MKNKEIVKKKNNFAILMPYYNRNFNRDKFVYFEVDEEKRLPEQRIDLVSRCKTFKWKRL